MTDFHVEVVRIGKTGKHPNADTLSITQIRKGIPCIFRTGDFKEGDLAVYVPVDAVVPLDHEQFKFLDKPRIRARKIRGIFSMGLLIKADPTMNEGDEVAEVYGITKWEDPLELSTSTDSVYCPIAKRIPTYDLESIRRFPDILQLEENILITEKLHGSNQRICWDEGQLYVGSKNRWIAETPKSVYWRAANKYNLKDNKITEPICLYGECYGKIQDLKYGLNNDVDLRIFDAYHYEEHRWLSFEDCKSHSDRLGIPFVPIMYQGPYLGMDHLNTLVSGNTMVSDVKQIREGIVVATDPGRWDQEVGRVKLKYVSEEYYLRK